MGSVAAPKLHDLRVNVAATFHALPAAIALNHRAAARPRKLTAYYD